MRGDFVIGVGFSFIAVGFRMVLRVGALAGADFKDVFPVSTTFGVVAAIWGVLLAFGVVIVALSAATAVIAGDLAAFLRAAELRVLDGIVLHAHQIVRRWRVVSECAFSMYVVYFLYVCLYVPVFVCVHVCCLWNHELKL